MDPCANDLTHKRANRLATKIGELYTGLSKNAFKPAENMITTIQSAAGPKAGATRGRNSAAKSTVADNRLVLLKHSTTTR
jgi:hypothetical protein